MPLQCGAWLRPPEPTEEERVLTKWLRSQESALRLKIIRQFRLKYVPKIMFKLDRATIFTERVNELLDNTACH